MDDFEMLREAEESLKPRKEDPEDFHNALQEVIGAVMTCVSRNMPLRAKKVDVEPGGRFGKLVSRLVLGLSSTHNVLCKTKTMKEEVLPLPLDTPFKLAEVLSSSEPVQFILLGLICGLNSLYGHGLRCEGPLSPCQVMIVKFLLKEATSFEALDIEIEKGDWKAFFNVRSVDYKGEEVRLAQHTSWKNIAPALPREIGNVALTDVCERGCLDYVCRFDEYLLPQDMQKLTKPPKVMVEDAAWPELCRGLIESGVCELIGKSQVFHIEGCPVLNGMFGVLKEEVVEGIEVHRLIMNLIPVNELCRPLEGDTSTLPAWPSMSPLQLQPSEQLLVSSEDVRCFFLYFPDTPSVEKLHGFQ